MRCGHSGGPAGVYSQGITPMKRLEKPWPPGCGITAIKSTRFISAFAWNETAGFQSLGFRVKKFQTPLGTILLDLSKGTDQLFRDCAEARRYNIRRAIKAGVEVTEMNVRRDFDDYYALYKHWCESKRLAPNPYELQRAVFETKGNRLLLVARHNGRMVGVSKHYALDDRALLRPPQMSHDGRKQS